MGLGSGKIITGMLVWDCVNRMMSGSGHLCGKMAPNWLFYVARKMYCIAERIQGTRSVQIAKYLFVQSVGCI